MCIIKAKRVVGMDIIFKRPVVSFCLMMILGIVTAYLSESLFCAVCVFLLLVICAYAFKLLQGKRAFVTVVMLLFFLLGALEFLYSYNVQLNRFAVYDDCDVAVKGYIASEAEFKEGKVSYIVDAFSVRKGYRGDFQDIKGKLFLTVPLNEESTIYSYGAEITFEGILSRPQEVRNPGGFNYRRYLAQKGVGASVFSYPYTISIGEGKKVNLLTQAGSFIRKRIIYVIENSLPNQQAGLLNGMLIGYREGLSDEVQEAFSNAGLTHIMAVSGANVAFLIMPLTFLLKKLRLKRKAGNLIIIAFLILFVYITGFEPSVLRAVVMASIMLIAAILYREPDIYAAIALSCIILLIASPFMLFNVGFQLSYVATLSLVMLCKNIKGMLKWRFIPEWIKDTLACTLSAQIGVLPITVVYFNKVSIISVIPNLLAVPMLEVITILGMLMAVLGQFSLVISRLIGYLNSVFLSLVLHITRLSSLVPFATIKTVTPSIIIVATYYSIVLFLLWYRPLKGIKLTMRHAAVIFTAAAFIALTFVIKPGYLEVYFLDVGQGDCAFIRTYSGRTVLVDGGGSTNPTLISKVGKNVVVPFILDQGVTSLDAVVATHAHSDHIQGLYDVLEQIDVKTLILPSLSDESGFSGLIKLAEENGTAISRCCDEDIIKLDERTSFDVLSPERNFEAGEDSTNNTSLVLKLCYKDITVMLTGDIETEIEEKLVDGTEELAADVIKIAHHGSSTSSSESFIEEVAPKAAVISVGRNNFGHPSPVTEARLKENGISSFRTDECGAVVLKSDGKRIKIKRTVGSN